MPYSEKDNQDSAISTNWRNAITPPRRDPLAIDLDGDGIETVGIPTTGTPILFDHDANGIKTGTGWLKGDDAWLVLDRDGNGLIDTGRELFGADTLITVTETDPLTNVSRTGTRNASTGFEALRTLDTGNGAMGSAGFGDGVFNASDAAFTQVKLWQDLNQDGISQSTELFTLADKGITSISLNASTSTTDLGNGNTVTGYATVTRSNGSTAQIDSIDLQASNLNLADNPFYREFTDTIPLTAEAQSLPDMGGSGAVRDLREAMSLGTLQAGKLTAAVQAFSSTTTRDQQLALLDDVLAAWAQTGPDLDAALRGLPGGYVYLGVRRFDSEQERRDLFVDAFGAQMDANAAGWRNVLATNPAPEALYALAHDAGLTTGVVAESVGNIGHEYMYAGVPMFSGVDKLSGQLREIAILEAFNAQAFLGSRVLSTLLSTSRVSYTLVPLAEPQATQMNNAYDALRDSVYGVLVMQTRLRPYLDAVSLVIDQTGISFDAAPLAALLDAKKAGSERDAVLDLIDLNRYGSSTLQAVGFDGMLQLRGWIDALPAASPLRAELVTLDMLSASVATGSARSDIYFGDAAANSFNAGDGNDLLDGGAGIDNLYGSNGNDVLLGREGNDNLSGDAGNDTLDGGAGNDNLYGGNGADTYLFGKGSGQDTISNYDSDALGVAADGILLGAGISPSSVTLTRSGDSLVISLSGGDDKLTVTSYFNTDASTPYAIETLRFADGTVWDIAAVKAKVIVPTAGNDALVGFATNDTLFGGEGSDSLDGRAGDDLLDGGAGADALTGGAGNDTLLGGTGNDNLTGGAGNDTLDGGAGDDSLYAGDGADTYLFGTGSGQDTINNYDSDALGVNADAIVFGAGITTSGVTLTRSGESLVISLNGSDDKLTVTSYFNTDASSSYSVESLRFADGTVWDVTAVKAKLLVPSTGNDTLTGYATNDTLSGGDGNDNVDGRAGDDVIDGGAGADYLTGGEGNDTLTGGTGNDNLNGGNGNDLLLGNAGNDALTAGAGNDTLDGGVGVDSLNGGDGADIYLFGKGSGQDTINNYDSDAFGANADSILLGAGITPGGVTLTRSGDSLVISLNGSDDTLSVSGYFTTDASTAYVVENIKFADGTTWDAAAVKAKVITATVGNDTLTGYATSDTLSGGDGNDNVDGRAGDDVIDGGTGADYLTGGEGNDTLTGGTGNDNLNGGNGNDLLLGNAGNDALTAGAGNDTLDGGAGIDSMNGGDGADTYLFGKGSGQDTINNYDSDALGVNADAIVFGAGITTGSVTLTRSGDNLVIGLNGSDDTLTVSNYFTTDAGTPYAVESLKFADGSIWDISAVKAKVITPTVGNDTLTGYATNDTLSGGDGNDNIDGRLGDDVIDGGTGADYLTGGDGNDTLTGGKGNDNLNGGYGNDVLQGSEGNDALMAGAGNDTLDGGAGVDNLYGGDGADTYLFGKGSGQDTINNYDSDALGVNADAIVFGAGITISAVTLTRSGDTLVISLNGSDDTLTVSNYFTTNASTPYAVETLRFADGTVWDVVMVKTKVSTPAVPAAVTLSGTSAGETLTGGAGNDALYGSGGNDTLDGGAGNDNLSGDAGDDTYLFNIGSGKDTISNYDTTVGKLDVVQLGAGITPTGVTLSRSGDSLLLTLNGRSDSLTLSSYFYLDGTSGYAVEQIKFADGTIWDVAAVKSKVNAGTAGNDMLTGYATADTLSGLAGDDTLSGRLGNDTLDGGAGDDTLNGEDGDDVLMGGTQNDTLNGGAGNDNLQGQDGSDALYGGGGNDTLDGGADNDNLSGDAGNDTYLFNVGSGKDTISNYDLTVGKLDVVQLGAGITPTGVTLSRSGDSLLLTLNGRSDSLTLSSYFYLDGTSGYAVEQIKFADGTIWDVAAVKSKVNAGTAGNDMLTGYATADTLSGLAGDDMLSGRLGNDTLDGGAGDDTLNGEDGDDVLMGGTQNDTLNGGAGNDNLQGQEGSDALYGGAGNDTLDGGAGNDALSGEAGNDTYLFNIGSGKDTISNYDTTVGKLDVVQLGAGITPAGVTLTRSGDDLLLTLNDSSDSLKLSSYFNADGASPYVVEQIRFADGTIWDVAGVKVKVIEGTTGDDTLTGYATADTLSGLGGDDIIYGRDGNDTIDGGNGADALYGGVGADTLTGGAGNDSLYGDGQYGGNGGNDVLDGGAGNDQLLGGFGNDTYLFGRGDGQDTISNAGDYYGSVDPTVGKQDVLQFKAGVLASDVTLSRSGDSLLVKISGSNDQVTISNYFITDGVSTAGYAVDQIRFDDGTSWSVAQVRLLVLQGTAANDTITGFAGNDTVNGFAGDDIAYGRAGNDTIDGGAGDDTLYGEDGNDSLNGGDGADTVTGGVGADTLIGGAGNDYLYGDGQYGGNGGSDVLDGGAGNDQVAGGYGSDTYLFGRGDGQDTVNNAGDLYSGTADPTVGKQDVLQFKAGVLASDITLSRSGDSLVAKINGSSDQVTVSNYFAADGASTQGYAVDQIKFADGTTWSVAQVKTLVLQGSALNDTITGFASNDAVTAMAGDDTVYGRAGNDTIDGGAGEDTLYGEDGNDLLMGGEGADTLTGGVGADSLIGGAGNDYLYGDGQYGGNGGSDVLDGGAGNDQVAGGYGSDTYLFGRGDGQDTVNNAGDLYSGTVDPAAGKQDVLQFKAGVLSSDVTLSRSGDSLVAKINGSTDQVTVANYFNADGVSTQGYAVDQIRFDDGTAWSVAQVKAAAMVGTAGSDTITGYATADTLDGGAGQDTLIGKTGNDTYVLGRGYGADVVQDTDSTAGNSDTLRLLAGVTSDQLWFRRVGYDLEVSIIGTTDKATVQNWYSGSAYHVEQFKTSDGKTLLDSKVQDLVNAMAAFTPPGLGQTSLPSNYQTTLLPIIAADWGP